MQFILLNYLMLDHQCTASGNLIRNSEYIPQKRGVIRCPRVVNITYYYNTRATSMFPWNKSVRNENPVFESLTLLGLRPSNLK